MKPVREQSASSLNGADSANRHRFPLWQRALIFSACFWVAAFASNQLSVSNTSFVTFWLPAGLYVGVLLLEETRDWPWFLLAALGANFLFDLPHGTPPLTILGFCCANTLEAVAGAWLVRKWVARQPQLRNLKEFVGLMLLAAGVGTTLGSLVGAFTLVRSGMSDSFLGSWKEWAGNSAMTTALLTPLILVWFGHSAPPLTRLPGYKRLIEIGALLLGLASATWYILSQLDGIMAPYSFWLMPFLLWAGVRFGLRGVTFANLFLAVLMAYFIRHFLRGLSAEEIASGAFLDLLHGFLATSVLISVVPTIVLAERNGTLQKLAESETRLRQFTEAAFESIVISENGRILDVNEEAVKSFRCPREQLVGREILDFVAAQSKSVVRSSVQEGREDAYENWLVRGDGTTFLAETNAKMVRVGQRILRLTAMRDITRRKQSEEYLRLHEMALKQSNDGIAIIGLDNRFSFVNEAWARMHGYSKDELIGQSLLMVHTPEQLASCASLNTEVAEKGHAQAEIGHKRKDGSTFPAWMSISAVKDASGHVTGLIGIANDITWRKESALELERARTYYQTLLETASDGIHILDLEGNLVDASASFYRMLGFDSRNHLRMKASVWSVEWPAAELKDRLARYLAQPEVFETIHRRHDGSLFPVEISVRGVKFEGADYIYASSRDITARKQAEAQLKERENQLQIFIEYSPAAIAMFDRDMGCLAASRRWLEYYHTATPAAGIEAQVAEREIPFRWRKHHQLCLQGVVEKSDEDSFVRADGSREFIRWEIRPWCRDDGVIGGSIIFIDIITARKLAEEKIREQARLIEEADDAIILRNLEGVIEIWNHGAQSMYGWTAAEALGRNPVYLGVFDAGEFNAAMGKLLQDGVWSGEFSARTRDQRPILVEARWTLLRDEQGTPKKVLSISRNVTMQRKLEAQLLRSERIQTIGTLSSGVAHDLNNILTPLLMGIPILREDTLSESGRQLLDLMEGSVSRGADIVRQLLLFARGGEARKMPMNPVRQIHETVKIINETFPKNLTLKTCYPEDIWPVMADSSQIYHVFLNLAVNARDAMPDGGVLSIAVENLRLTTMPVVAGPQAKPGPYVAIRISDTGEGMPPEVLDHIFEPFYTTKEFGKGTGLGLSVVLGVVQGHGGFVDVHSSRGAGSEFIVYLPAVPTTPVDAAPDSQANPWRGNGELILAVDDEPALLNVLVKVLEKHGYRPLAADGGAQALKLQQEHPGIAAVISDFSMPGMDGFELATRLKLANPELKIMIATGLADSLEVTKFQNLGVQSILRKPYSAESMLTALGQTLSQDSEAYLI